MATSNNTNQDLKKSPEVKIVITMNAEINMAFNYIAPINLMHIFRGNALIPAIVDTSVKEGWNKAGLTRTVYFKDGSTSQETLLAVNEPFSFSYKNEQFTSKALAALLKRLEGKWLFTELSNNQTKIEWTYRAVPTNLISNLVVRLLIMKAVRSMMSDALNIIKSDIETGQLEAGTTWKN